MRSLALLLTFALAAPALADAPSTRPADEVAADVASFDVVWETVGTRYYDETMNGVDWDAARDELRPKVEAAASREEARSYTQALLNKLGESHLVVIPSDNYDALAAVADAGATTKPGDVEGEGQGFTGLSVRSATLDGEPAVVAVDVFDGTPAAEAGITPGSVIVAVDGKSLGDLLKKATETMPAEFADTPRAATMLDLAAQAAIDGGTDAGGTSVELTYDAGEGEEIATVLRGESDAKLVQFATLPPIPLRIETRQVEGGGGTAVYASFSTFLDPSTVMPQLRRAVAEAREDEAVDGFVLDLRGNIGGLIGMGQGVAGLFVGEKGRSLGTMKMRGQELRNVVFPQKGGLDKPLAVLVDSRSMSMSEILAGGLQDIAADGGLDARVFGRNTAGAALPAEPTRLPNGDGLIFVIADHELPSGRRLEGVGVVPDEAVPLDRDAVEAMRRGEDPTLAAALKWIASR